jgi:hypothetical protein
MTMEKIEMTMEKTENDMDTVHTRRIGITTFSGSCLYRYRG